MDITKNFASRGMPTLITLMAIVFATLVYTAFNFRTQMDGLRTASSDSRVWSVTQIEVDYQNLLLSIGRMKEAGRLISDAEALDLAASDMSLKFDVFFTRVVVASDALDRLNVPTSLKDHVRFVVKRRDTLADTFDSSDMRNGTALATFEKDVIEVGPVIRRMVLEALQFFVFETKEARKSELLGWTRFLEVSIVLLLIMGIAMLIAYRVQRQLAAQLDLVQSASDNIRMIYEASMMGVIVIDAAGTIVIFNKTAEKMSGFCESEVKGTNISEQMIPEALLEGHLKNLEKYRTTGRTHRLDSGAYRSVARRADGSEFPIEISVRSNREMSGRDVLILFVRDVSEQMAYESNLRDARDEARRHANAKALFLATMSHEMRTPLHGLLASFDLIDLDTLDQKTVALLDTARDCAVRSLVQVNDILELSEMDEVGEEVSSFSPAHTVSKISDELRAIAKDKGNHVNLHVTGAAMNTKWQGMPKTFGRVMYNLIGNALKFTKDGTVTVNLSFTDGPSPVLSVSVEDTGIGISQEDQARVLELYFSGKTEHDNKSQKNSGLGLPIAQAGVKRMGGALHLRSEVGEGSRFYFDVPVTRAQGDNEGIHQITNTAEAPTAQRPLDCLVVDDNVINLELTARLLEKLGHRTTTAIDGYEAVALANEELFDVIFMDMNMPGLCGRDAIKVIREASMNKDAWILAHTADVTLPKSPDLAAWGIDRVLVKPAGLIDLAKVLLELPKDQMPQVSPVSGAVISMDALVDFLEMVGVGHGGRLLDGMLSDVTAALGAMHEPDARTADLLHRAIGSTGAVGLAELSMLLRHAETNARSENWLGLTELIAPIKVATLLARGAVAECLSDQDS